jgi:hypothetical protein
VCEWRETARERETDRDRETERQRTREKCIHTEENTTVYKVGLMDRVDTMSLP